LQPAYSAHAVRRSTHVADMDIFELRCALANGFRIRFRVLRVQYNRLITDITHHDIADTDIFDDTTAATRGLQADTTVCPIKYTVGNHDIFHATRHLTTNDHAAMSA